MPTLLFCIFTGQKLGPRLCFYMTPPPIDSVHRGGLQGAANPKGGDLAIYYLSPPPPRRTWHENEPPPGPERWRVPNPLTSQPGTLAGRTPQPPGPGRDHYHFRPGSQADHLPREEDCSIRVNERPDYDKFLHYEKLHSCFADTILRNCNTC